MPGNSATPVSRRLGSTMRGTFGRLALPRRSDGHARPPHAGRLPLFRAVLPPAARSAKPAAPQSGGAEVWGKGVTVVVAGAGDTGLRAVAATFRRCSTMDPATNRAAEPMSTTASTTRSRSRLIFGLHSWGREIGSSFAKARGAMPPAHRVCGAGRAGSPRVARHPQNRRAARWR